jgi:N-acyl-phosphatidylethanolamine-hydrolysing phospholipase D
MSVYDCTVATQPGPAPDDAKAKTHHLKDKSGKTVGFVNVLPAFGRWKDMSLLRAGCIFFRCVASLCLPVAGG